MAVLGDTMKKWTLLLVASLLVGSAAAVWRYWPTDSQSVPVTLLTWRASGKMVGSSNANTGAFFLEEHPDGPIDLVVANDQWSPEQALIETQAAIRDGVQFFVTAHPSNCAVAIRHLFAGPDTLAIVTGATTPVLSGRDDYIFRIIPDTRREQRAIARYIGDMPGRRLLVVQDEGNLAYTDPAFQTFSAELSGSGDWRIDRFRTRISEFRPDELEPVMARDHDILYILAGSYQPSIGHVAQLWHHLHPEEPIMLTPWARSRPILEIAGPALDRIILPSIFPSRRENAAIDDYARRFHARYGGPGPFFTTPNIRIAFELLNEAFVKGHRTPEAVKQYLLKTPTHETSLMPVSFDRFGDVTHTFYFMDDLKAELR